MASLTYVIDNVSTSGTADNTVTFKKEYVPYRVEESFKEVKDMRRLYQVVVVDYENDEILANDLKIAKDAETARVKALAPFADEYDLDDLDVICNKLGNVRKKREVQKVEVVEGGDA